jgi:cystathionine beta-lyase/cystathionine gamma-synthase
MWCQAPGFCLNLMADMKTRSMDSLLALKPGTLCVHAGTIVDENTGGVTTPIFTATSYAYPNPRNENCYPRYFNVPNQNAVCAKLAALEKGEDALVFGSGMAAISTVLFAFLKPGDHVVSQQDLYGGTFHFVVGELTNFGIEVSFAPNNAVEEYIRLIHPNTKVLYIETPSNPLLSIVDIAPVAKAARERGLLTIIDNTFASPINQTPLELGIDIVAHSGTKYLNGHSDVNCGAVISSHEIIQRVKKCAINHGGTLDVHACYLLERGLKTLALRVAQQNRNAQRLAEFLAQHPAVARVNYPGLPSHPEHATAARQMRGFGGMLSFELKTPGIVAQVLGRFKLVTPAISLGGVESLICVPAQTSHSKMTAEQRHQAGVSDGLLRVSAGIEEVEDLVADFDQALRIP